MSLVAYVASDEESEGDDNDVSGCDLTTPTQQPTSTVVSGETKTDVIDFLSALPPPRSKSLNGEVPLDDVVEEEFKKVPSGSAGPVLPPGKKTKQPVKITIPTLLDPDSDEENPKPKKIKPSTGKCGLFALLPEPRNITTKVTSRSLVPHNLTKKPIPSKPSVVPKGGALKRVPADTTEEDEDEASGQTTNFFDLNDASPSSRCTSTSSYASVNSQHSVIESDYVHSSPSLATGPVATSQMYNQFNEEEYGEVIGGDYTQNQAYEQLPQADKVEESNQRDIQDYMKDEQFLRLASKRQRGKEEITIVDIHADDATGGAHLELTKGISQEQSSYVPSAKKGAGPSGQQKRKKQITYLAHQAKAMEVELKNQWAQNRMNRRAAQNKYGF